jgi:hypothetical protein
VENWASGSDRAGFGEWKNRAIAFKFAGSKADSS